MHTNRLHSTRLTFKVFKPIGSAQKFFPPILHNDFMQDLHLLHRGYVLCR